MTAEGQDKPRGVEPASQAAEADASKAGAPQADKTSSSQSSRVSEAESESYQAKEFSFQGIVLVLIITLSAGFIVSVVYHSIIAMSYSKGRTPAIAIDKKSPDSEQRLQAFKYVDIGLLEDSVRLRTATKAMLKFNYQDALAELDAVSQEGRNRDQSWFTLQVESLLSTKQSDKVYKLAEDYIKNHPGDYAGPMWMAQAYEQDKKYDKAIENCKKAYEQFKGQKDDLIKKFNIIYAQKMIEAVNGLLFRRIGACSERMENHKEACINFEKAFLISVGDNMAPTLPLPGRTVDVQSLPTLTDLNQQIATRPKDANLYYQRAIVYKALGKYDLALADVKTSETLRKGPENRINFQKAGIYFGLKDYKAASREMRKVFAEDPLYEQAQLRQKKYAFVMLPVAYMRKSQVLKTFDKMIMENPDAAINYYYRGMLQMGFRDYELSAKDLQEYFSLNKDKDSVTNVRANLYLAICRNCERRTNEAQVILEKAAEEARNYPWWHAVTEYMLGKTDDRSFLQSAGTDMGRLVQAHYFIGQKLSLQGKDDAADKEFKLGIEQGAPAVDEYYLCKLALVPELKGTDATPEAAGQ